MAQTSSVLDQSIEQPSAYVAANLQWTTSGEVLAHYLVTPCDYGLRPVEDKLDVKELHGFLAREVPNGTLYWGVQTDLSLREVLRRMVNDVNLDDHEAYAQESLATYHKLAEIGPTKTVHGMSLPIGTYVAGTAPTPTDVEVLLAEAAAILSRIGDGIKFTPATETLVAWLWERNIVRGVDTTPFEDATPSTTFPEVRLDTGARTDGQKFFARTPVLKVASPELPEIAPSYQQILTIKSFPTQGNAFPGAEFLDELPGVCDQTADWCMRVSRTPAERVIRKNTKALRSVGEQMEQRSEEVSFAQNTLSRKVALLSQYTTYLEDHDGEDEVTFTTLIAVGSPGLTTTISAGDAITRKLKRLRIQITRPTPAAQAHLWTMFNPGTRPNAIWDDYAHITPTDMWAGFTPFISSALGDRQGPVIAINLGSGHFEPVHMDIAGVTGRDMSGCFSSVGELGSGKSFFQKTALDLVYNHGGHWIAIDRTDMGEYATFAEALPDRTIIDAANPSVSLDPLRLFSAGGDIEDDQLAADFTVDTYLPLMDISPNDTLGVMFANLLTTAERSRHGITDSHRLIDVVGHLADAHGPDAAHWSELHTRLTNWASRAAVLFDPTLPSLSLSSRATVIRTHQLSLPNRAELANEHLYRSLPGRAKLGACIYALIGVTARFSLFRSDRLGLFNGDEAHHFTLTQVGKKTVSEFARDGRKHNALMSLSSHDPGADWEDVSLKLVPTRFVFRQRERELAEASLRWVGIDPDDEANRHLVKQLQTETAPMRGENFDSVPLNRRGECIMRDALGRISRAKIIGLSTADRRQAAGTTPGRQVDQ